jgi:hypothetical protein
MRTLRRLESDQKEHRLLHQSPPSPRRPLWWSSWRWFRSVLVGKDVFWIVLKPGLVGRLGTRPIQGWNRAELKKNRKSHDPVWPGGLTRQNPVKNSVATCWFLFVFFLKRHHFDFFLNMDDPGDSMTQSKLKIRALDQARFKNYDFLYVAAWLR